MPNQVIMSENKYEEPKIYLIIQGDVTVSYKNTCVFNLSKGILDLHHYKVRPSVTSNFLTTVFLISHIKVSILLPFIFNFLL